MQSSPASEEDGGGRVEAPERDLAAEVERLDDRYKRALADLDNFRKRSARETERRLSERTEAVLRDWLEALDSVERALRGAEVDSPLAVGLQAVLDQMDAILERYGVKRDGAVGEPFDPERHEAVGVAEPTDELPDGTIVATARSGFALGDRVLRPAEVVVAQRREREG
jgi:molecular chaperone GrpE